MSSMIAILALTAAAAAQDYGKSAPPPRMQVPAPAAAAEPAQPKLSISKAARKALLELQAAVNANDVANIPAKLAAAQAVAQSSDEKYAVAQLQLKAAAAANNDAAITAALEAMLASGGPDAAQVARTNMNLGAIHSKSKQYA
ncbi:MAG TPA: hypothetical protein VE403_03370, partial [Sphingomicrobium sp.]|nr:hypothetical protein [Sphingomicrobium sp.]